MNSPLKLQTARSRSSALEEELLIWNNHAEQIEPFHKICTSIEIVHKGREEQASINSSIRKVSSCRNESCSGNDFA